MSQKLNHAKPRARHGTYYDSPAFDLVRQRAADRPWTEAVVTNVWTEDERTCLVLKTPSEDVWLRLTDYDPMLAALALALHRRTDPPVGGTPAAWIAARSESLKSRRVYIRPQNGKENPIRLAFKSVDLPDFGAPGRRRGAFKRPTFTANGGN